MFTATLLRLTAGRPETILNLLRWNECKQIPSERFDSPPCAGFLLFPLRPLTRAFLLPGGNDER